MRTEPSSPATAEDLPTEDQDRLARILDEYLGAAERGEPISPEQLLERHPDDAVYLRGYLSGLELFHNAAGQQPGAAATGDSLICQKAGQTIGDYRLIREVGRGGMGVVYEAEQLSLKRRVALKVLPFVAAHDEKHLLRFQTESQTAASIEHPHIVPVYAIGEEHGVHFYAMQFIEGDSLAELIGQLRDGAETVAGGTTAPAKRPFGVWRRDSASAKSREEPTLAASTASFGMGGLQAHIRTVAKYGSQAARALHAAHDYGVVHRDVKPSNLMIDESGKLWITDFGLARCREGSGLTQTGDILGTLKYMSPEQADGRAMVDHRTDVYSLGITLYEAAILRQPLADLEGAFPDKARAPLKPLRHWEQRIPSDFETILLKAVSDNPAERYATAADMADDLERFLADEPIRAKRPSLINRAGKWVRKHQRVALSFLGAAAFAIIALTVALFLVMHEQKLTAQQRDHARRQTDKAVERTQELTAVLETAGWRVAEQLQSIPGAERVRHQLLDETLNYYRDLVRDTSQDPALRADMAVGLGKIGELTAKIGDQREAIEHHRRAELILRRLCDENPADQLAARRLAVCQNNIGELLNQLGREEEALQACSQALQLQQELLDGETESAGLLSELAATYSNLGLVHKSRRSLAESADAFVKAIEIQQQIADSAADQEASRRLAVSFSNLASIREADSAESAREYYTEAIAIQKTLVEHDPLNLVFQSDLARTYNNLGYLAASGGDSTEARACYETAIRIQTELVEAAPALADYRRELAVSQNNLAMAYAQQAEYPDARRLFKKAAVLQQQLLSMNPNDLQALMSLGGVLNNVGVILERQGDLPRAQEAFRQAVDNQRRAFRLATDSGRIRGMLSNHLFNLARCSATLGDTEQAAATALQRRELWLDNPEKLFGVAKELLGFLSLGARSGGADDQIRAEALETLRLSLQSGLDPQHLADKALGPLQNDPHFQAHLRNATEGESLLAAPRPLSREEG